MYPARFRKVTGAVNMRMLIQMSIQSLITPAMFMVKALVLPMSKKTARLRQKAVVALASMTIGRSCHVSLVRMTGNSSSRNGSVRQAKQAGDT